MELVLLGAECPGERSFAGSLGAAAGAQRFWRAVTGTLVDAGPGRCRVTTVHPETDANAVLAALQQAAAREGRLLLVYLAGQLVWDQRRRRPVVVVAGSLRDSAARRGLPCDWVTSAMAHGAAAESLLVLDLAAEPEAWQEWPRWEETLPAAVPVWGRVARYEPSRRGRNAPPACAGALAEALGGLLETGLPGAPAVLDPGVLHPALAASEPEPTPGARPDVHWAGPPVGSRLLLRNRAALRGLLGGGVRRGFVPPGY
ncbi:hypothetical protein [Streptacidiphilus jiangxiensis]|uniref:Uncharacterized protein n=1 Tax=Streptacidiphilus jiangxiensis TaxID=235985 RepID=A0A1H7T686_STRJI|nr:hypothetical protein [Streptacidiphilus jiangxiensis]SEL80410.1 hypothetical protein SAMN05414137_113102 [Streptacidiphilus jiangxiensis]